MIVGSILHYFYFLLFLLDELLEELLKKFQSMKGKSILIGFVKSKFSNFLFPIYAAFF